jgi:flagellar hook-associated protein 1 FlgK
MATINTAFSLISNALNADQTGLSIVANNVANANTAGYTEEVSNFQQNAPININGVSYGDGVTNAGPVSIRDNVLETRLAQQQQSAAASSARLTALDNLQSVFTPSSGSSSSSAGDIGTAITAFFSSLNTLEGNATDNSLRQSVLSSATTLANNISSAASNLTAQQSALDQQAASLTGQINSLTSNLAALNLQIQSASPNKDAGTLQDQREQDISKLSQMIGINQTHTENNGLSITTTSGQLLVSEGQSYKLTTGPVGGATHFFLGTTDITASLVSGGGQLGGLLTTRDTDIPNALSSLDQLAYGISTQVNTINNAGTDMAGDNGGAGNIFSQPAAVAGSALAMSVVMTDPNHIAASALGANTGDNANLTSMAALANQSSISGQTPSNYYSNFVTSLGATVSGVQSASTATAASVTQLQTQVNTLSGVNLNNEAASMQQLERSYQAASQVFAILNTVMASALNLGSQTTVA